MAAAERVPVAGSERALEPGHTRVGDVDLDAPVDLTVYVRPRAQADWVDDEARRPPAERRRVDRDAWAAAHGAAPEDIDAVTAFARQAGLTVTGTDPARRAVMLRGPLRAAVAAFGATIEGEYQTADGKRTYRARSGALTVPAQLGDVIAGVFGIDDRPQAQPRMQRRPRASAPAPGGFTPRPRSPRRTPFRRRRPARARRWGSSSWAAALPPAT